jgi:hypothetical protein
MKLAMLERWFGVESINVHSTRNLLYRACFPRIKSSLSHLQHAVTPTFRATLDQQFWFLLPTEQILKEILDHYLELFRARAVPPPFHEVR